MSGHASTDDAGVAPTCRTPLIFNRESLAYDFGADHPLNSVRLSLTVDLIRALRMDTPPNGCRLCAPPADASTLSTIHDPGYVAAVRALGDDPRHPMLATRFGFGLGDNPPFAGMHEAASSIAGGAAAAAQEIAAGRFIHAFHVSGGLHHASRARASGFCVYNDVALACAILRDRGLRVLYVDGDAHHGDGTESVFAGSRDVLTISLHESGLHLFPGTGFVDDAGYGDAVGYAVNVPLEPGTGDDSWLECFGIVVPEVARAFRPDVIVSQHGCDSHVRDPLTHLACTTRTAETFAREMHALAHAYAGGRWLATGGGGYDAWDVVPRAWTLVYGAVSHQLVPETLPDAWRERWAAQAVTPLPTRTRDETSTVSPAAVRAANRDAATRARDQCLMRIA